MQTAELKRRNDLTEKNLGLVRMCANHFRNRGIEYDDLYGAGCIGLLKASEAFDESRGAQFSTYAVPVIMGEIKRLFRDGGLIKVSRSLRELSLKALRERDRFMLVHGREPFLSELADIIGASPEDTAAALDACRAAVSLTRSGEDDDDSENDIACPSPDDEMIDRLSLAQIMESLSARDRKLIYLRYYKEMTQSAAAEILGMTQVQVSRREKKILSLMRERF